MAATDGGYCKLSSPDNKQPEQSPLGSPHTQHLSSCAEAYELPPKRPLAAIAQDVQDLRANFRKGLLRDLDMRRTLLLQLQKLLNDELASLQQAVQQDLHKHPTETYACEISLVLAEIQEHLDHMHMWAKPQHVGTNLLNLPGSSMVQKDPLGVALIIGTWNYPVQLLLMPLVGCISAGNCAMLRLAGEDTCGHTNAVLIKLLDKYMDKRFVRVVYGGVDETKEVLKQRFDLIFCTGGTFIGKLVAKAAAEYLTPTVLELGGKSPAIVDASCDLEVTARRLTWGAFVNAGQTCVRPDYVLVDQRIGDQLIEKIKQNLLTFFGKDPAVSDCYGRLINRRSFDRVAKMLEADKGFMVHGGAHNASDRYIEPTIFNFKKDFRAFETSEVMAQEIFGPLLPVYYYEDLQRDALSFIQRHEKPLALYVFTTSRAVQDLVMSQTSSGSAAINDCMMQLSNSDLPFGGVGNSGMGRYHGKFSFDAFCHHKAVLVRPNLLDAPVRYMPYTETNSKILKLLMTPIPRSWMIALKVVLGAVVVGVVLAVLAIVGVL